MAAVVTMRMQGTPAAGNEVAAASAGAAFAALAAMLAAGGAAALAAGLAFWAAAGLAALAVALLRPGGGLPVAALRRWVLALAMVLAIHWASRHGFGGLAPGAVAMPVPGPIDGWRTAWRVLAPSGRRRGTAAARGVGVSA